MKLFEGRDLLIVTKHSKEKVLKPLLEKHLKVNCILTTDFDTDTFGTFSGEIIRKENALSTIRNKCRAAMSLHNSTLAVASEGSFGPHPTAFFAAADDELVILIDLKNNLEIIGRKLSLETNYTTGEFQDVAKFREYLKQVKFPSHKIILRKSTIDTAELYKDIETTEEVITVFESLLAQYGLVSVETDMRAMNNPTRMKVIEEAAEDLISKIKSLCPNCKQPGFSVSSTVSGLKCSCCNLPTRSTLYQIMSCSCCNYEKKNYFPRNIEVEDPMYCDNCNP